MSTPKSRTDNPNLHRIARQLFELVAGLQGMSREELLKHTLDMTILQSAPELKKHLQAQRELLDRLESGQPLHELDAEESGESGPEGETPLRVPAGPGAGLLLQSLSRLTHKAPPEILQDALGEYIKSRSKILRKDCDESLNYIRRLESRTERLDTGDAGQ